MESTAVQQNLILFDWVSFTTKKHTPEELIAALGLSHLNWQDTTGARGYRSRKYYDCISIHYDGRDDMGVWCEMSGQGCRAFESFSELGWDKLFKFILDNDLHMTRLDVAYDDHTGVLDIQQVAEDTRRQRYISKSDKWSIQESGSTNEPDVVGLTVQIGSSRSAVLFRIYDKAVERGADDGQHWVRIEMQLRDERAAQFIQIPKPIGEAFCGVLLNYLRYVVPSEDTNKSRWEMTDYWRELIGDAEKISLYTAPGTEYNEERCRNFVVNLAGNAIDACIKMYGLSDFGDMIKNRDCQQNPKYQRIVERYRMEHMAADVREWFDVETPIEPAYDDDFPNYENYGLISLSTGEIVPLR